MPIPDVFNTDAFNMISMTNAIQTLPFVPKRIGQMGLFEDQGVATTSVALESNGGVISLLKTKQRGEPATRRGRETRKVRNFAIPHIPYNDTIKPEDIQNVRKFGSESELESLSSVVNDRLSKMRRDHEITLEWLRVGALKGIILDGDASTTLYNLFTEFGISASADVDFLFGTDTTDILAKCITAKEEIETALGDGTYTGIHCLCGKTFFQRFTSHPAVKYAYMMYQQGDMLRSDSRAGFEFAGITFEVYRGSVGGTAFIGDTVARFFPVGVPGLFVTYYAPADFNETANTIGLPIYAKQRVLEFDRGIEIHTQSNPLPICTIPGVLVQGITSN